MTNWKKQGYGPNTDVCCRCLKSKESTRRRSKWCARCDEAMSKRKATGALDGARAKRAHQIPFRQIGGESAYDQPRDV